MTALWAALLTAAALWLADHANRHWRGWLPDDPPRPGRKQHGRPVPLAGIVVVLVVVPWWLALGEPVLAAAGAIAGLVGYWDDRGKEHGKDLDWRRKALGLAISAGAAVCTTPAAALPPHAIAAAVGFTFVLVNATNFLDNTDGVAGALSATSLLLLGGEPAHLVAAGAALGFLPWNWPRPRLFLGDAGAYLLGLAVAVATLRGLAHGATALAAVAVQLADFVQVVTARLVLGRAPWVGDRRHLTHIAQNLGMPRSSVAPAFVGIAALVAAVIAVCR